MLSFTFAYGSFWRRAFATTIDVVAIMLVSILLFEPAATALGVRSVSSTMHKVPFSIVILRTYGTWAFLMLIVSWLYCAFAESSVFQATLGKRLMGLMVFSSTESRLSFRKASIRFWTKVISIAPLFAGFILALFDGKRRTLHDRIAGSIVLQANRKALDQVIPDTIS